MPGTLDAPKSITPVAVPKRPLRVVYAIDTLSDSGGTELHAVRLAEHMVRSNASVRLVTLNGRGGMRARYETAGIEIVEFPVSSLVGATAAAQVRAMAAMFRREHIDVVHAHDCYTNFLVTLAGRLAGVPLVVASKRWTRNLRPQHAWTNRVAFRAAHLVTANSSTVADSVHRDEWIPRKRIEVTPNFLEDESFQLASPAERSTMRSSLGFAADHVVFAILAQLRVEKDHPFLLEAFAKVVARDSRARLLIVGDGPERARIEQRIAELSLGNEVRVVGHTSRPRTLLSAADVCVLTSRHEGFPNALLEGMAVGLPVVSTAAGGVVDAVRDGVTGLLSPVGDLDAFTEGLLRLASDERLRRELGAAARAHVERSFRASAAVQRVESLYRTHLENSR